MKIDAGSNPTAPLQKNFAIFSHSINFLFYIRGLVSNFNPRVPLYNTSKNFAGATGLAYLIKLKILRVPKYTSQDFVGARHPCMCARLMN